MAKLTYDEDVLKWKLESLEFLVTCHGGLLQIRENEDTVKDLDPSGEHRCKQYKRHIVMLQGVLQGCKSAGARDKMIDEIKEYKKMLSNL